MKTYQHPIWVQPTETVPIDFYFELARTDTIATLQRSVYDITDNAKTDIADTIIGAGGSGTGVWGPYIRLAVHNMTLGKSYHIQAEAETALGQTLVETKIVHCGYQAITLDAFPYGGRVRYTRHFDDKLPAEVTIDANTTTGTAYDQIDLTTNVWNTLNASLLASDRTLTIDLENLSAAHTYIVNILARSTTDSVTNQAYWAAQRLVIPCREF